MKSAISLTLVTCFLAGASVTAQDHGHFFVFVAPGDATSGSRAFVPRIQVPTKATLVQVGGGGEGALGKRWGIGTDLGVLARTRGVGRLTTLSGNGFYHPLGQHHLRIDPYFTAGYGWFNGEGHALGFPHLGGGLNYWLAEHHRYNFGFKLEFRRHARGGQETVSYREARISVALWQ